MPASVSMKPILDTFPLEQLDSTGETTVTVRQATTGDVRKIGDLFGKQTQIFNTEEEGQIKIEKDWNFDTLKCYRAFLTITDCNIVDEATQLPVFKFVERSGLSRPVSETAFNAAWDALHYDVTEEIYERVLDMNPMWRAAGE